MKYGYVKTNLTDLWSKPKFNSERLSQLLFGNPLKISTQRSGFLKVAESDGYAGWVDSRFIGSLRPAEYEKLKTDLNVFVNFRDCQLFDAVTLKPLDPYVLYYGTRLRAVAIKDKYHRLILPDQKYVIRSSAIISLKSIKDVTAQDIVREARRFLGVPYLWGGITTTGFDCSGLVRTVFQKYGIYLPRDTKDQIKAGQKIDREEIESGDLLFFNRHVAIAVSKTRFIHSSVGGGGVRMNSFDKDEPDYRADLDKDFKEARRVL